MKLKQSYLIALLCMLCTFNGAWAQYAYNRGEVDLTEYEKKGLEKQAKAKVETFQNNCKKIGECKNRALINTTMDLFSDDERRIQISNLSGNVSDKKVRTYLNRLSMLGYEKIEITSYDCRIAKSLKLSDKMNKEHPGEEWYEGIVSIMQHFRGERGDFVYEDVVQRNMTVYARKVVTIRGGQRRNNWIIQLGDIKVKTISEN